MTAASPGPGPGLFSIVSQQDLFGRTRPETFAVSLFGQGIILAIIIYFTSYVIRNPPPGQLPKPVDFPLVFSGHSGGGGGNFDPLPANVGDPPRASLDPQLAPPDVIVPKEMPKLPVEETVVAAPDIKFPAGQIGDPMSRFSRTLSNGPGGPGGIGDSCCDGIGTSTGPHVGDGPPGIFSPGRRGVTVPQVIFDPEPTFSEEARKSKTQGTVRLLLVVGKDGHPYDVRVRESLGMGLDEKAIEAVNRWRFRPATFNGLPVATQIEVQVEFHLY